MLRSITVLGPPIPQGSKRHVGRGIFIEANKKLPRYREDIVDTIIEDGWHTNPILTGPVSVKIGFYLPRPKTHYGTGKNAGVLKDNTPTYHDKCGDIDKLCRAVLDAITIAGAWRDDGQVAELGASKYYGQPRTVITIEALPTPAKRP